MLTGFVIRPMKTEERINSRLPFSEIIINTASPADGYVTVVELWRTGFETGVDIVVWASTEDLDPYTYRKGYRGAILWLDSDKCRDFSPLVKLGDSWGIQIPRCLFKPEYEEYIRKGFFTENDFGGFMRRGEYVAYELVLDPNSLLLTNIMEILMSKMSKIIDETMVQVLFKLVQLPRGTRAYGEEKKKHGKEKKKTEEEKEFFVVPEIRILGREATVETIYGVLAGKFKLRREGRKVVVSAMNREFVMHKNSGALKIVDLPKVVDVEKYSDFQLNFMAQLSVPRPGTTIFIPEKIAMFFLFDMVKANTMKPYVEQNLALYRKYMEGTLVSPGSGKQEITVVKKQEKKTETAPAPLKTGQKVYV